MGKMSRPPEIGKTSKAERNNRKISLSELSERSGVSKGMLSQIENGTVNPTIATAWKISNALGFSLHELFGEEKGQDVEVIRRDEAFVFEEEQGTWRIFVLSPAHMAEVLELYWIEMDKTAAIESRPHAKGAVEFATVIDGTLEISSGKSTKKIGHGDTARYRADVDHCIRNVGEGPATVYLCSGLVQH